GGVRRGPLLDRRARGAARRPRGGAARPRPVLGVARLSDGADRARCGQAAARVYLSRELWRFTAGVRARIAWTVVIGLIAVVAGIARLALLGWLLAKVLAGPTVGSPLLGPVLWHRRGRAHGRARQKAYAAYGAEFLDTLQGLPTLKAFGQSAARRRLLEDKGRALFESTMWVLGSNVLTRGIADTGIA